MKQLEILATMGPSRRAKVTVIEMVLQAEPGEADRLTAIADQLQVHLPLRLTSLGLEPDQERWAAILDRPAGVARLAGLACQTALFLQNKAGHEVQFEDFLEDKDPCTNEERYRFIFEHDDAFTGELAGDLAMRILAETCPDLKWTPVFHDATESIESSIKTMLEASRAIAAPPDVLLLAAAARDRGIPVLRLERDPYGPLEADFRVAPNGMLMLGQSRHRVLLDGLFCIERPGPGFNLMKDRRLIWQKLAELGAPKPSSDMSLLVCATILRARRVARRIGYPVRVWPLQRDSEALEGWKVDDEAGLQELFARPNMKGRSFMVEPEPQGQKLDMIFAGDRLIQALLDGKASEVDPHIEDLANRIARAVSAGLLLVRFSITEAEGDGPVSYSVTHLDPAPSLHQLLEGDDKRCRETLECFLDWVIPPGTPCGIPVIAVTGTNGKTTTTTMISRIAQAGSRCVGMAQTGGVYFGTKEQEIGDLSGFLGHCMVFENSEVDLAVLETARGDLIRSGFAYDYCDVAVCTNVTADHLGQHGIETVEQMVVIKRSVLERAVKAVVLNGDDPHCMEMLPFLSDKTIFLSTFRDSPRQLRSRTQARVNVVNVEKVHGEDWIVLHEQERALPVIAVNAIPATFNGHARHNISNAMHAIAAARAVGLNISDITRALSEFELSFESLPGRLNVHDNGRFHVIMDYAHNEDGIRQLARFTDQYPCKGRKILRFGVSPDASELSAFNTAAAAAGHFDYFVCAGKPRNAENAHFETLQILKQGLIANGVPTESIAVVTDPAEAFDYPMGLCQQGDLLVLVTNRTSLAETWQKILTS